MSVKGQEKVIEAVGREMWSKTEAFYIENTVFAGPKLWNLWNFLPPDIY